MSLQFKRPFLLMLFILLLAFGLRLYGLDSQSLWWDELKTVERAIMPLDDMLTNLIGIRNQVPFYYWLMRFWAQIGTETPMIRMFSVFCGILSIPLMYQIGRKANGIAVGELAAFLLAISPFHIWYSQELRMYTLLLSALLFAHLALLYLLEDNKVRWWLLYGISMTVAIYSHYFAFLVVMAHYIFFVLHLRSLKQHTGRWFVTMIGVGTAFAPWVWLILTRAQGYGSSVPPWINPIRWVDLLLTFRVFSIGFGLDKASWLGIVASSLFLLSILANYYLFRVAKDSGEKRPFTTQSYFTRLLLLWLCTPLLIVFLVSINIPFLPTGNFSIYNDRYLIICLPPFLLLAAQGWQFARQKPKLCWGFLILITLITVISILQQANNPKFARNDWRSAIAQIDSNGSNPHLVIGHRDLLLPTNYYGNERTHFIQIPPPETNQETSEFDEIMRQRLDLAANVSNLAWHAESFYNQNPHGFPDERNSFVVDTSDNITQNWLKSRFASLETVMLPGIRMTLYDISKELE